MQQDSRWLLQRLCGADVFVLSISDASGSSPTSHRDGPLPLTLNLQTVLNTPSRAGKKETRSGGFGRPHLSLQSTGFPGVEAIPTIWQSQIMGFWPLRLPLPPCAQLAEPGWPRQHGQGGDLQRGERPTLRRVRLPGAPLSVDNTVHFGQQTPAGTT
jgi:hypothetical protein